MVAGLNGRNEIERVEAEEFARGHIGPEEEAAEARPAATVVLARAAAAELEVLLLRRPEAARFAAGAYVFPGGVIDPADREEALGRRLAGAGVGKEWPALVAGLRELFEETGILLSDDEPAAGILEEARRDLLANRVSFHAVVERCDLTFARLRVAYFARWVTPERLARRYDARFFLAEAPAGTVPPRLTPEHTDHVWLTPRDAVRRFHGGELPMLFPTWKTLRQLAEYRGMGEAVAALSGRSVEPIQARLIVEGGKVRPVMPGDPGYEDGR